MVHSYKGIIFAIAPAIYEIALRYRGNDILADEKSFLDVGPEWVLVRAFNNPFLKPYYDTAWRYAGGGR
jgi:hypothetical protein